MIEARVVADSLAPCGARLTTFVCTYPRFLLAEVNTHRMLSRNSASSRAIPVEKMMRAVAENPAIPVYWGASQKGMQAGSEVEAKADAKNRWLDAASSALSHAQDLLDLGLHKQVANRVLEPFAHTTTIISATEWENFFSLRADPMAQPEFQELAYAMMEAYLVSEPRQLATGQWHLPFADRYVDDVPDTPSLLKISTARCARVSYLNFEGEIAYDKDYALHDGLVASGHSSPAEHPARALTTLRRSGNFVGFEQYRKTIPGECRKMTRGEMEERLRARRAS